MVRFFIVIISCFFLILYYVPKMSYYARHGEKYDEETCYRMAQVMIEHVKKRGRIETVASGMENLPTEGGYIMFANHQGKYDALGVISVHEKPCTYVMDAKRSHLFIVTQLCELLKAKRLDKTDLRQQVQVINDVATEVKAGRRYILFPEGGYDHNHNSLRGFLPGSFKIAQKAKCPIVPVVLYDSFKPFEGKSFRKVITQLHFLPPIPYETFADMKTYEIRDMVVSLIQNQLDKMESLNDW
ncbi:MAG: lysophospholipid acyltransferase family protein [Clostridium sp.]|jgi:1-acyl-sn-glycerol-3-phosphate acyltransferase|uniref:lysophospholipid acyltransferase family protein n=1 Tax=Clostridia TaxID=186801 RepID=UPI00015BDD56|nr:MULTISPECIES: lysophospholipid acyltransferase family protein [unclassified Clostridium]EDO58187.1 Acyltransferase [Clostridium sp. L2-50]UEA74070.1 1-acyl-sn-glycerol-3-phosphate acyltransferase [Lachnospiraceae bacterium GAM79]UEA77266.1 1-acyl-sn-glycerol-3-phosphate acyltransferase [Lachnospiraceae bacterium GAM79]